MHYELIRNNNQHDHTHPYCPIQILYLEKNLTHYVETQELLVYKSLREIILVWSKEGERSFSMFGVTKAVSGVIEEFPADSGLCNCKMFDLAYFKLVPCTYDICDIKWRLIKQCYNVLIWHASILGPKDLKIYLQKISTGSDR